MSISRTGRCVALLAAAFLLAPAFADSKAELDELMSHDGLQKIKVKGMDLVYALPGATLADYHRVQIDPVTVAFHKSWDPDKTGSRFKLTDAERENIKSGVAKLVRDEFVKELQTKSSYQVVDAAGPDVLRIKADIINLYVNAPDTMSAGRSKTYTVSAGEMTLVMELYDSETGQVLSRVIDRREARDTGMMTLTNSVVNASEARMIASSWARILRNGLDKAHGIGKQ
jgi:Protein of unknown function (DUF3313)